MRQKFRFLSIVALLMTLLFTVSCDDYDNTSGIQSLIQDGSWKIISMVNEDTGEDVNLNAQDLEGAETTLTFLWNNTFTSTGYFREYSNSTWTFSEENYRTSRDNVQELNCRFEDYTNETVTIYIYDGYNKFIAKAVKIDTVSTEEESAADSTAVNN